METLDKVCELEDLNMQELCDKMSALYPVMRKLNKPKSASDGSVFSVSGNGRIRWQRDGMFKHSEPWVDYYPKARAIDCIRRWTANIESKQAEMQLAEQKRNAMLWRRENAECYTVKATVEFKVYAGCVIEACNMVDKVLDLCDRGINPDREDVGVVGKVSTCFQLVDGE